MKRFAIAICSLLAFNLAFAQTSAPLKTPQFFDVKTLKATSVKNQAMTGTCWCFATTSLVESEEIRKENKAIDLSEMFTVRNMYV
ncbi:MAG TPA: C1 family peptidase, partial [Chitinophagaceae bacterium]